ncbi:hypothetical protein ACWOB6_08115 [Falseniella ignava]
MDQVSLLKMYAEKLAQRLGDDQQYLEFTASRDTGHGIEMMRVKIKRVRRNIDVWYFYTGCHAYEQLPEKGYAKVLVDSEDFYAIELYRSTAYTYFPDIEKLLEQL